MPLGPKPKRLRSALRRTYEIALFAAMLIAVGVVGVSTAPGSWATNSDARAAACTIQAMPK
jgi:hypothetical protein